MIAAELTVFRQRMWPVVVVPKNSSTMRVTAWNSEQPVFELHSVGLQFVCLSIAFCFCCDITEANILFSGFQT